METVAISNDSVQAFVQPDEKTLVCVFIVSYVTKPELCDIATTSHYLDWSEEFKFKWKLVIEHAIVYPTTFKCNTQNFVLTRISGPDMGSDPYLGQFDPGSFGP